MRNDIATLVYVVGQAFILLIFARVLMSWLPTVPSGIGFTLFTWLRKLTDPYLNLFRGLIPPMGGIDFSPVVAILVLIFGLRIITNLIAA